MIIYKAIRKITQDTTSQRFSLTNVSWLLNTRNDTIENKASMYFLVCKGLSIDDVGVSRDTAFQEIRPGAGFETGDFRSRKFGGATVVERLTYA